MKKKLLVIFLFFTVPIWILPFAIYIMIKETWTGISELVNKRIK